MAINAGGMGVWGDRSGKESESIVGAKIPNYYPLIHLPLTDNLLELLRSPVTPPQPSPYKGEGAGKPPPYKGRDLEPPPL